MSPANLQRTADYLAAKRTPIISHHFDQLHHLDLPPIAKFTMPKASKGKRERSSSPNEAKPQGKKAKKTGTARGPIRPWQREDKLTLLVHVLDWAKLHASSMDEVFAGVEQKLLDERTMEQVSAKNGGVDNVGDHVASDQAAMGKSFDLFLRGRAH